MDAIAPGVTLPDVSEPCEVRMRFAARCTSAEDARRVGEEVESLYLCGPAGGGGVTRQLRQVIAMASTLIPADQVTTRVDMVEDA